jgi:hypothetical protein
MLPLFDLFHYNVISFHLPFQLLLFPSGIQEQIDIAVISKILQNLESAYAELEARHETYLETFESDNEDDKTKVNELNHDITVMYNVNQDHCVKT